MSAKPRVEISRRLVLFNSASSLLTRLLSASVLIWLQQYLLKRVTPEEYSLLPVLYSVMMFAPLLSIILTAGLGRYAIEAYAKHDDERVTQIVSTMFPILCIAGLAFLGCGWTLAWYIDSVLSIAPDHLWDARIMMAMLIFVSALGLPLAPYCVGFFVRQKFVLQNAIRIGTEVFRLTLLFALLFGIGTRVTWVIVASTCAEMLSLMITVIVSRRLVPALRFRASHIRWELAKAITGFGGWTFIASVANTICSSADVIILNKFATPLDVTCFHVGAMPLRQIQDVSLTARSSLNPALTAMHATGDQARLRNVYLRGGRLGLWAVLLVAMPLTIYSTEVIRLYAGEKYAVSALVMVLLLSGFPIGYASIMTSQLASATANIKPYAINQIIVHSINLSLTLYFVGYLKKGAVGSALATFLASNFLQTVLLFPLGLRLAGSSWGLWLRETVLPGLSPALAASVVWVILKIWIHPQTWLTLGLCTAAGGLCYAVVLVLSLRPEDRKDGAFVLQKLLRVGRARACDADKARAFTQ